MTDQNQPKRKAALARAKSLTAEQRSQIAKKAAGKRWAAAKDLPRAEYGSRERPIRIGDLEIACYVLNDGRRVLTQEGMLIAMGRAAKAKGGQGVRTAVDGLPPFIAATNLKPLIPLEISQSTTPIEFITDAGVIAFGYPAELLPEVCRLYLRARDEKVLLSSQKHIAIRADMLVRALAATGIVALIDEATGFQEVRAKNALQEYLERFIRKELAAWVQRFPEEFFKELYRLKKWPWTGSSRRPGVVGRYIKDLVYERLGPGVLEELERVNPTDGHGRRRSKHHQWLSDDLGIPGLSQHMHALIGFMRAEDDWHQFRTRFNRAFPKRGGSLELF